MTGTSSTGVESCERNDFSFILGNSNFTIINHKTAEMDELTTNPISQEVMKRKKEGASKMRRRCCAKLIKVIAYRIGRDSPTLYIEQF